MPGQSAITAGTVGGKGGQHYVVCTTCKASPEPGMPRYGVTRTAQKWIVFQCGQMVFNLKEELTITSYKTIDEIGSDARVACPASLVVQNVKQVILHNLHVNDCEPTGGNGTTQVMSTETYIGFRGKIEVDVLLWATKYVWVDHLYL